MGILLAMVCCLEAELHCLTCSGGPVWNCEQVPDESDDQLHYEAICFTHARVSAEWFCHKTHNDCHSILLHKGFFDKLHVLRLQAGLMPCLVCGVYTPDTPGNSDMQLRLMLLPWRSDSSP